VKHLYITVTLPLGGLRQIGSQKRIKDMAVSGPNQQRCNRSISQSLKLSSDQPTINQPIDHQALRPLRLATSQAAAAWLLLADALILLRQRA
jgi:hypothetical protein